MITKLTTVSQLLTTDAQTPLTNDQCYH